MTEKFSLWPTWTNRSTGMLGPYASETEALSAALLLKMGRHDEILRLVLQRPDGTVQTLVDTQSGCLPARSQARAGNGVVNGNR